MTTIDIAPGDTIEVLGGDLKGRQFTVLTATVDGRISFDYEGHRAWARKDAYRKVVADEKVQAVNPMAEGCKHPFSWPTSSRPAISLACHQQMHGGCNGYGDPLDNYWCGCRCHDPA